MAFSGAYGIDLGSSNIKIFTKGNDSIFCEKNMIAIQNKNELFAYGDDAFEMYEKAPGNISITYPLSSGVIADIKNMQMLVRNFISDLNNGTIKAADYYIAVPTDVTEVEKRAFYDLIKKSNVKAKKVMVVEKAIADGLGLDIDVKNSQGVLVVDVGYETTEISILSLGGIVVSKLIKVGGKKFDESIREAIRREYNLLIGAKTAEQVKMSIGELVASGEDCIVYGRDIVTGLPVERGIPTNLALSCMQEDFNSIVDYVKIILERTPPELAADVYRKGLYLTGGASQVHSFAELLSNGTGLKVNKATRPIESVALGIGRIIQDDNYKSVAYSIEGINGGN